MEYYSKKTLFSKNLSKKFKMYKTHTRLCLVYNYSDKIIVGILIFIFIIKKIFYFPDISEQSYTINHLQCFFLIFFII